MPGTITLTGLSASEPAGQRALGPMTIQGSVVVGDTVAMPLAAGDNVVSVPTGSVGVVIIPPPAGSATLKLRASLNSGEGGLPISASQPSVYVFPSPIPSTVILNASGAQTAITSFWFW